MTELWKKVEELDGKLDHNIWNILYLYQELTFILVDSLKEGVLDTSPKIGSFLVAIENSFKNGDAKIC